MPRGMLTDALQHWLAEEPVSTVVTVSAQDITRFAIAIGAADPVHFDAATARAQGYAGVVAPDTFYLSLRTGAFNLVPQEHLHEEGTSRAGIPPIVYQTAMAGQTRVVLYRRFVAGESVRVTCTREKAAQKQGRSGVLTLIDFRYDYTTEAGDPIATEHFTRIFR
jgi:acyl dehydratase